MNLTKAQPSAFALSEGQYLTVIQNLSQLMGENYQLQQQFLSSESAQTNATALSTLNAGMADAASVKDQAFGEYAMGGLSAAGGALSAGYEGTQYYKSGGISDLSGKIDTLEENEKTFYEIESADVATKAEIKQFNNDKANETIVGQRMTRAKDASAADKRLDKNDLVAAQSNDETYNAIKKRVKEQKANLLRRKEELTDSVDKKRAMFNVMASVGQMGQASYQTLAANEKANQAVENTNQTIRKYLTDTSKSMADTDSQANQTLISARESTYQNLEAIVRSNQPN